MPGGICIKVLTFKKSSSAFCVGTMKARSIFSSVYFSFGRAGTIHPLKRFAGKGEPWLEAFAFKSRRQVQ
jgi:hypothetical protein